MKLVIIVGSVRKGRFGLQVGQWFRAQATAHAQFDVDVLDVASVALPWELPPNVMELTDTSTRPAELRGVADRLAAADAFVVVTPEYNHSFPASLKHLVDWHFTEWQAKPIGFVSYGGHGGGLRAIEQLRLVFAELHAATVRDTVSFDRHWERFAADGSLADADGPNAAAKVLLDSLAWWARALTDARAAHPYAVA